MKVFAPEYYEHFKCIADKCTHSCCVGWRIELDERTFRLYSCAEGEYADELKRNIASDNDGKYIPLTDSGRCPHLDSCGLCNIIREYGESYLSDICTHHPRFYNQTSLGTEAGIGASCPEAARLILDPCEPNTVIEIAEDESEAVAPEFDCTSVREKIFDLLRSENDYTAIEASIWQSIIGTDDIPSLDALRDAFSDLEYLNESDKALFSSLCDIGIADSTVAKRLLHYFIYRHLADSIDELDLNARIGFALLSVMAVLALSGSASLTYVDALVKYSEEIEYSTDNTEAIIFEISAILT